MELVKRGVNEVLALWSNFMGNIIEWLLTIALMGCAVMLEIAVEPHDNRAVFENFNERYPYSGETIGVIILFFFVIILPCAILGLVSIFYPKRFDLGFAYMSLAQVLGVTLMITEVLKIAVARPRPNYFSYCQYDQERKECLGPHRYRKDAKVSFPSGHASNSFASATWLALLVDRLNPVSQELWWILLKFLPIAIAIFISATRITDYMHHVSDVVAGAILGVGIAAIVFKTQAARIVPPKKTHDLFAL